MQDVMNTFYLYPDTQKYCKFYLPIGVHVWLQVDVWVQVAFPVNLFSHTYCISVLTGHDVLQLLTDDGTITSASNIGQAAAKKQK